MMMSPLITLLFAQFTVTPAAEGLFEGTCLYPEAVRERAAPGELVNCNVVEIESDAVTFGRRGWNGETRFNGSFDGDRMTVTSVTLNNRDTIEVRGVCQLYFANDELSTVACTASSNRGSVAANFVVSKL